MPTSRLGGHLVSGHVDGIGEVKSKSSSGRAIEYWIKAPGSSPATSPRRGRLRWMASASPSTRFRGICSWLTIVPHTARRPPSPAGNPATGSISRWTR